jgi:hypothetical protein
LGEGIEKEEEYEEEETRGGDGSRDGEEFIFLFTVWIFNIFLSGNKLS